MLVPSDFREIVSPATMDIYGRLEILGVVHRTYKQRDQAGTSDPQCKIRGILLTSEVSELTL